MSIKYFVGAHIKRDKTICKTIDNIRINGGNALQIFVSSPLSSTIPNIDNYIKSSENIKEYLRIYDFKLIIHSPYTINIANDFKICKRTLPIDECYWIKSLLHELYVSNLLNAEGVVLHVGKHVKLSYEKGLENMKIVIDYIVGEMIKNKYNTKLIIETPAGQGTELLKDLVNFVDFYNSFTKEQQKYIGICLDTAHVWALGYELNDAYDILFEKNSENISVIHLNNSRVNKGSMKDRHASMLNGVIPNTSIIDFIKKIKNNKNPPIIILETPTYNYNEEIDIIYSILN
jgi:deoxyribonuclease-4